MIYASTTLHMLTHVFLVIHIIRHINTDFMQPPFCSTCHNSICTFTKHLSSDRQITATDYSPSQEAIYCARHDVIT